MFGFSFGEFVLICVVALVFVGPQKLPGLLRTLGQWVRKARSMVYDMRAQSGIDEILRAEGFHGGLGEMRSLLRGQHSAISALTSSETPADASSAPAPIASSASPYEPGFAGVDIDATKEYPPEGADAYGALPDDLADDGSELSADPVAPPAVDSAEPAPPAVDSAEPAPPAVDSAEPAPPGVAPSEPLSPPAPSATAPAELGNDGDATTSTSAPSPPLTP